MVKIFKFFVSSRRTLFLYERILSSSCHFSAIFKIDISFLVTPLVPPAPNVDSLVPSLIPQPGSSKLIIFKFSFEVASVYPAVSGFSRDTHQIPMH